MKRFVIIILLTGCLSNTVEDTWKSRTFPALDQKCGFKNHKLGDSIETFDGLIPVKDEKSVYTLKNDDKKIGEYEVKEIKYAFHNGILYSIGIKTENYDNSTAMLRILKSQYGPGFKINRFMEQYVWQGDKVRLGYTFYNKTNNSDTVFIYLPIYEKKEADDQINASKTSI